VCVCVSMCAKSIIQYDYQADFIEILVLPAALGGASAAAGKIITKYNIKIFRRQFATKSTIYTII